MITDITITIAVRIAVATSDGVFLIPHFARIEDTPAKNAEPIARITHIASPYRPT